MNLYKFLLNICGFLIRILYRVEISGNTKLEKDKSYIIASNHASYLDPVVIAMAFPQYQIHYLGKKELFKNPFFSNIFHKVGVIPVDRSKNDITAVKAVLRLLKNNNILGIFPQGTRVRHNEEEQSKAGLGMFAIKTGSDIVPITIESSYQFFTKIKVTIHQIYKIDKSLSEKGSEAYMLTANQVMNIIKG